MDNDLITKLLQAWQTHPDMRFCQLVNAITLTDHIFYITNDEFKTMIERFNEGL